MNDLYLNHNSNDIYYMMLAINQAKKAIYIARPNPAVGCILVKDNIIIGAGYTSPVGGNHAEINALNNALNNNHHVENSTAYVTLEPCSHYGKTPPCSKALIKAGIKRVVVAGLDTNPKVAGRGVKMLQDAGIKVTTGLLTDQAKQLNEGFLKAMRIGMPYVRLKIATSLDGKTAMASGESQWITGEEAREDVQKIRALSGAIITGSQTVIDDDPSLNVRSNQLGVDVKDIPQPKVVVLDRRNRLSEVADYKICKNENTIFCNDDNLKQLLNDLVTKYQIYDVMVEAGAKVVGSFIKKDLVDELIVYQAPCLLGSDARAMADFKINNLSEQKRFKLVSHETIGTDFKLTFIKN
ncbi:MAG: riboflavin biosynthesis protein RibD [Gammaproteobacteria bacterium]|nr:MAG: riboflavin biosynthesis protein RibD [Gammaproteobacteria bacterium]